MKSSNGTQYPAVGITEPPISNARLGMMLFIASEAMLFAGLIAGYVVLRGGSDGFTGMEKLPIGLAGFSTAVLVGSSIALISAQRGLTANRRKMFEGGTVIALLLGLLFTGMQWLEWTRLSRDGQVPESNVQSGMFYAMSGIHGVHVLGGLVLLAILATRAMRGEFTPRRRSFVTVTALYWHFVTVVWMALFIMLFVL